MPSENSPAKHKKLTLDVRQQIVGYVVAALSLVAGLAWNDAVKSIIEFLYPADGNSLWAKVMYALVLSVIIGLVSYFLLRLVNKDKN